jgi:ribulose 1,5-bisphosphate carboxylase large subunit-like protein
VLAARRLVQDDHILLKLRVAFDLGLGRAFPENVRELVCEIASRVPTTQPGHSLDPMTDDCGIKVVSLDEDGDDHTDANSGTVELAIPLAVAPAQFGLPLLLAIAGYGSVFASVREYQVLDLELPETYLSHFSGPAVGVEGIFEPFPDQRALLGIVLRPRFQSSEKLLFEYVAEHVAAGVDFVFDDELTVGNSLISFDMRVATVRRAIDAASDSQRRPIYIANVLAGTERALALARQAGEEGADGVMVNPIVMGYDVLRELAADITFPRILVANFIGRSLVTGGGQYRISPTLLCKLARLAGADAMYIQPFAGSIRNPEKAASQYESALWSPFSAATPFRESVGVMSGGIALTEFFRNQDIYGRPLMLTLTERCAQAWEQGIRPGIVFSCISEIAAAVRSGSRVGEVLLSLDRRSSDHRICLEILGVEGLS